MMASLIAASAISSGAAGAVDSARYDAQGAAAVCQPALPEHGANIRAQPLTGLTNGRPETIFLTCGFRGDDTAIVRGGWHVSVNVANYGTVATSINCTLVNGRSAGWDSNATYTPGSISLLAGGGGTISWRAAFIEGAPPTISRPTVMCGLPSGAAVQFIGIHYLENVGN